MGLFGAMDIDTQKKSRMDVARILISTSVTEAINMTVVVRINELNHSIRMMEDCFGTLAWKAKEFRDLKYASDSSSHGFISNSLLRIVFLMCRRH